MSDYTRLTKSLYYPLLDKSKYLSVGDFLVDIDGICFNMEEVPEKLLIEIYGFTKEELYAIIAQDLEEDFYLNEL